MKKRIISLLMCLVMTLSIVPTPAWAALVPEQGTAQQTAAPEGGETAANAAGEDGGTAGENAASPQSGEENGVSPQAGEGAVVATVKNEDTGLTDVYTTLYEALHAAVNGSFTVTVQQDVDLEAESYVTGRAGDPLMQYKDGVTGSVTLDLNGCTVDNRDSYYSHVFEFEDPDDTGALTLTIRDSQGGGSIQQGRSGKVVVQLDGAHNRVNIEGGTLTVNTNAPVIFVKDGVLTVSGGALRQERSNGCNYGALWIEGGEAHITGGEFTGKKTAVWAQGGKLTVSGTTATLTGGDLGGSGLQVEKDAEVELSGGNFARMNEDSDAIWRTDGSKVTGLLAEGYRFVNEDGTEATPKGDSQQSMDNVRVLPVPQKDVTYLDRYGDSQTVSDYVEVTADLTALEGGKWYVVRSDVTLTGTVPVSGGSIILCDGAHLTINGQLVGQYDENQQPLASLNIYGQSYGEGCGVMTVTNTDGEAFTTVDAEVSLWVMLHGGQLVATGTPTAFNGGANGNRAVLYLAGVSKDIKSLDNTKPEGGFALPTQTASVTIGVCTSHVWEYQPQGDGTHYAYCKDCNYHVEETEGIENCVFDQYASNGDGTHSAACVCGAKQPDTEACGLGAAAILNDQQHVQICSKCQGQVKTAHTMDAATYECTVCGFAATAVAAEQDDPETISYYGSLQAALDGAAAQYQNGVVTLLKLVGEDVTFAGGSAGVTVDLNGCTWYSESNMGLSPALNITGGSLVIVNSKPEQGGVWQSNDPRLGTHAIVVSGGTLTVGAGVAVVGGSGSAAVNEHYAIDATGGTLALNGAQLTGGLRVSGDAAVIGLTKGAFMKRTRSDSVPLNVSGSERYENVAALLANGYALAQCDNEGNTAETPVLVNGYSKTVTENVAVVAHAQHDLSTGVCPCGYTCAHVNMDANGWCADCEKQFVARVRDGKTYYFEELADALEATDAENFFGTVEVLTDAELTRDVYLHRFEQLSIFINGHSVTGDKTLYVGYEQDAYGDPAVVSGSNLKLYLADDSGQTTGRFAPTLRLGGGAVLDTTLPSAFAGTLDHLVLEGATWNTPDEARAYGTLTVDENARADLHSGTFKRIEVLNDGDKVSLANLLREGCYIQNENGGSDDRGSSIDKKYYFTRVTVVQCDHADFSEQGRCYRCGLTFEAVIEAADGTKTHVADMDALKSRSVPESATLRLLKDVTMEYGDNTQFSYSFTLDMNGHSLTKEGRKIILNGIRLTVVNSKPQTCGMLAASVEGAGFYIGGSELVVPADTNVWIKSLTLVCTDSNAVDTAVLAGGAYGTITYSGTYRQPPSTTLAKGYAFVTYTTDGNYTAKPAIGTDGWPVKTSSFATGAYVKGSLNKVAVVAHTHSIPAGTNTCECGLVCDHTDFDADGKCSVCGYAAPAKVDETFYVTITDALAAANGKEGSVLTLLDDVDAAHPLTVTGTFTLDLNGKKVDTVSVGQAAAGSSTYTAGALTVTGDTGNITDVNLDSGTLEVKGGTIGTIWGQQAGGTATISGGTVTGLSFQTADYHAIVTGGTDHEGAWGNMNGSTLTISGGTFGSVSFDSGTPVISGGTFAYIEGNDPISALADCLADGYAFYGKDAAGDYTVLQNAKVKVLKNVQVGTHTHDADENGDCACGKTFEAVILTADGTQTCVASVDALSSADLPDGSTLKLLKDVTLGSSNDTSFETNVTLDLNGHSMTKTESALHRKILVTGELTVINSKPAECSVINGTVTTVLNRSGAKIVVPANTNVWFSSLSVYEGSAAVLSSGSYMHLQIQSTNSQAPSQTVSAWLADGYALKNYIRTGGSGRNTPDMDENGWPVTGDYETKAYTDTTVRRVTVVAHTHSISSGNTCACGFVCQHTDFDADGKCIICGYAARTKVNETFYATITEAVAAANGLEGSVLTLLDDIPTPPEVPTVTGTFTLDLNGKWMRSINVGRLAGQDGEGNDIYTAGALTVTGDGGKMNAIYLDSGTLEIKGGTINLLQGTKAGGTAAISGGTVGDLYFSEAGYHATVTGGTGHANDWSILNGSTLSISGGTFGDVWFEGAPTISDGTFGKASFVGVPTISGGTFADIKVQDPDATEVLADYLAEGYAFYGKDAEGNYTVLQNGMDTSLSNVQVKAHAHDVDENGVCGCGQTFEAVILTADGGAHYLTDMDALTPKGASGVPEGATVRLLRDVTLSGNQANGSTEYQTSFTLDLNGRSLKRGGDELLGMVTGGTLTIVNSKSGVYGKLYGKVSVSSVGNGKIIVPENANVWIEMLQVTATRQAELSGGAYGNLIGVGRAADLLTAGHALKTFTSATGESVPRLDSDGQPITDGYATNAYTAHALIKVAVVAHTHSIPSGNTCECGFVCDHANVSENGDCPDCGSSFVAALTDDSGTIYVSDLAETINGLAADSTATIRLLKDAELYTIGTNGNKRGYPAFVGDGVTLTLDLNGHSVYSDVLGAFQVGMSATTNASGSHPQSAGTLKIIGSGSIATYAINLLANGTLDLSGWTGSRIYKLVIQGAGKLDLGDFQGKTIQNLLLSSADSAGVVKLNGGTIGYIQNQTGGTITAGDILADGYALRMNGSLLSNRTTFSTTNTYYNATVEACAHDPAEFVDENGLCACGQKQFVAKRTNNTGIQWYTTLGEALDALENGDTLTLLADVDLGSRNSMIITAQNVVLDLNGRTVTGEPGYANPLFKFTSGASVTMKNGTLTANGSGARAIWAESVWGTRTELTLANMTVQGGTGGGVAIVTSGAIDYPAVLTIESGRYQGVRMEDEYAEVTLNGGTFVPCDDGFSLRWKLWNGAPETSSRSCMALLGDNCGYVDENDYAITTEGGFRETVTVKKDQPRSTGAVAVIDRDGTEVEYGLLTDAINDVKDGETIHLLRNLNLGDGVVLVEKTSRFTLDLEGWILSSGGAYTVAIRTNDSQTAVDVTLQKGKVQCTGNTGNYAIFSSGRVGTANVTLDVDVESINGYAIVVSKLSDDGGKVHITGGHYTGTVSVENYGRLELSGGTFEKGDRAESLRINRSKYNSVLSDFLMGDCQFWDENGQLVKLDTTSTALKLTVRPCQHIWSGSTCTVCGKTCVHTAPDADGKCESCGQEIVAQVDTVYYTELNSALVAASVNRTTAKLLASCDLEDGYSFPRGTYTLDLNDKMLNRCADEAAQRAGKKLEIPSGANVTLYTEGSAVVDAYLTVNGNLTLEGGVNVAANLIPANAGVGHDLFGDLTMKKLAGSSAVPTINAPVLAYGSTLDVSAGRFNGDVYLSGGKLTVRTEDVTFASTSAVGLAGGALEVLANASFLGALTVTDSTLLVKDGAFAALTIQTRGGGTIGSDTCVLGGTFGKITVDGTNAQGATATLADLNMTGTDSEGNPLAYVFAENTENGGEIVLSGQTSLDGVKVIPCPHTRIDAATGECACGTFRYAVIRVGYNESFQKGYATLEEAVADSSVTPQRFVRLCEDVTLTQDLTFSRGILDLNGHTLTVEQTLTIDSYNLSGPGTVTGSGQLVLTGAGPVLGGSVVVDVPAFLRITGGSATINGTNPQIRFTKDVTAESGTTWFFNAIVEGTLTVRSGATVEISTTLQSGTPYRGSYTDIVVDGGRLTVDGGEASSQRVSNDYQNITVNSGSAELAGGEYDNAVLTANGGSITINGSTVYGGQEGTHFSGATLTANGGTITVNGGEFLQDTSASGSVILAGGTYERLAATSGTVGGLLKSGYAFRSTVDSSWISDVDVTELSQVTVMQTPLGSVSARVAPDTVTYGYETAPVLGVSYNATGAVTYQWHENGRPISGATTGSYTLPTGKDAGTYTYYVVLTSDGYTVTSDHVTLTVEKASVDYTAPTAQILYYTGQPQELVTAGSVSGGTLLYSDSENGVYTTSIPTGTAAGDHTVWYKVEGDANHLDVGPQPVAVTIRPRSIDPADLGVVLKLGTKEITSTVYTGAAIEPQAVVTWNGEALTEGTDYTVAYADNTVVGTAIVTVTGQGNYSFTKELPFVITPASLGAVSVAQSGSLTYNGAAQTPDITVTGGTVDGTEMKLTYSTTENGTYGALPAFIEATGYTVYYKAEAANHQTATGSFRVSIAAKDINGAKVTLGEGLTYNGKEQAQSVTSVVIDGLNATFDVTGNTGTDAKEYTLTVTGNGNFTGRTTAKFTIAPKSIANAEVTLGEGLTYNGTEQSQSVASVVIDGLNATFDVAGNTGTDAKEYTLTVTGNGNFTGSTTAKFTIAPKSIKGAEVQLGAALTYNGKSQTQTVSAVTIDGADLPASTYTVSGNKGTDAKTYTLTVTVNSGNYTGSITKDFTIAAKDIADAKVTLGEGLTYNGKEQAQSVTSVVIDGLNATFDVSDNTGTDAKEYTLTVTGNGNFTGRTTAKFSIAPKSIVGATVTLGEGLTYNGAEQSQSVASVVIDGLNATFDVSNNTGTDAKEYTLTVTGNGNFTGTATAKFSIAPKSIKGADVKLGAALTYNGKTQTQTVAAVTIDGADLPASTYTVSDNKGTDAKTYTLTVTVNSGNYTGSITKDFTIAAKDISGAKVTLGEGLTYNGKEQAQSVTSVVIDGLNATFDVTGNTGTDAREYTLTVTGNGNFTGRTTAKFTIAPKSIVGAEVTLGESLTYNGKEQAQSVASVIIDGLNATFDVSNNTGTDAKEYTLTVTGNGNFTGSTTAKFTIAPKSIKGADVKLGAALTYNGKEQTQTVAAVTIDGADLPTNTYTVSDNTGKDAKSYTLTVTVNSGNYTGTITKDFTIAPKSIDGATVTLGEGLTYNGKEQAQSVTSVVIDGLNATFDVTGNTGTDAKEYTLTVIGNGNFTGRTTAKFTIAPKSIVGAEVTLGESLTYNGAEQAQSVASVVIDGLNATFDVSNNTGIDAEEYTLTVTGNGNFTGSTTAKFTIAPKSIKGADVKLGAALTYNGKEQTQTVAAVTIDGADLPASTYTVSGNKGTDAKTYTLTVTVNSGNYTGSITKDFTIAPKSIDGATVTLGAGLTYNGKEQAQTVSGVVIDGLNATFDVSNNTGTDAKEYTLTVTGNGNFTGRTTAKFSIAPKSIKGADVTLGESLTYNGAEQAQSVSSVVIDGLNATFDVSNNTGTDAKEYTLTVTGNGNFTGRTTAKFTIAPKSIKGADVKLGAALTYNGKTQTQTVAAVTIDGADLPTGTYTVSDNKGTDAKTYTLTVTVNSGNYTGTITKDFTIAAKNINGAKVTLGEGLTYNGKEQAQSVTSVVIDGLNATFDVTGNTGTDAKEYTLTVTGNGNFTGTTTAKFTIAPKSIAGAEVTLGESLTYNGAEQAQSVASVVIDGLNATFDVSNNTGTDAKEYTLTVTGNGNFTGTTTAKFTIAPKSIKGAEVQLGAALTYNGKSQTQTVSAVTIDGADLPASTYTVSGNKGTDAKTYTLTVTVNSGNYTGTITKDFTIAAKDISGAKVTLGAGLTYNGKEQAQSVSSVVIGGLNATFDVTGNTGTDAKEYTLTVTGNGNFTGTTTAKFTIAPKSIAGAEVTLGESLTYNGAEQAQSVASVVVDGLNATFDVSNNTGTDSKEYTLTVTGNGNFTGSTNAKFSIAPKSIQGADVKLGAALTYNGKSQTQTVAAVTIDGLTVPAELYAVSGNTGKEAGDYTLTVTITDGINFVGTATKVFPVNKAVVSAKAETLAVVNGAARTYTVDLKTMLPALKVLERYGTVVYGAPVAALTSGYYTSGAAVVNGVLTLPIDRNDVTAEGPIGTVTVTVSSDNFRNFDLTVNVTAENKGIPTGTPTLSRDWLHYGESLSAIRLSGTMEAGGETVRGVFRWVTPDVVPSETSITAEWVFIPNDTQRYISVTGTAALTVRDVPEDIHTVLGSVIYTEGVSDDPVGPVAGADVAIAAGSRIISRTTTGEDGSFSLAGVPSGEYNVVITVGTSPRKTVTAKLTVTSQDGQQIMLEQIHVRTEDINSRLDVSDSPFDVVVGGLDQLAERRFDGTPGSTSLTVDMAVKTPANDRNDRQQKALRELADGKKLELMALELTITRNGTAQAGRLADGETLELIVPYDTDRRDITVYRSVLDDSGNVVTEALKSSAFQIDSANGCIRIQAQQVGLYAIASRASGSQSIGGADTVKSAETGDTGVLLYAVLSVVSLGGVTALRGKRRRED